MDIVLERAIPKICLIGTGMLSAIIKIDINKQLAINRDIYKALRKQRSFRR